jgi:hypothetical protein
MKKRNVYLFTALMISAFIISCNSPSQKVAEVEKTAQDIFFERFKDLEGKSFAGREVFIREGVDSWAELDLVMHVREFTDSIIYVPFRVGENTSRTWTLYLEPDGRLRLRHDHRHPDGTPEELSLYGGYSGDGSTALSQLFPADEFTCNMLARICDNEWNMMFDEELTTFSYILRKAGDMVIRIDFDLTTEI